MERNTGESKSRKAYHPKKAAPRDANWHQGWKESRRKFAEGSRIASEKDRDAAGALRNDSETRRERRARKQADAEEQSKFTEDLRTGAEPVTEEINRVTSEQLRQAKNELRVAAEEARREAEEMRRATHKARRVKEELLAASERLQEAADEHTAILTELSRQEHRRSSSKA
ncbi:MAG: hypothetical protein ACREQW_25120 [Candidatus Binatia bacterium]